MSAVIDHGPFPSDVKRANISGSSVPRRHESERRA